MKCKLQKFLKIYQSNGKVFRSILFNIFTHIINVYVSNSASESEDFPHFYNIFFFVSTKLKAVLVQLFTDRNTRDHLAWTIRNGDHMPGVWYHTEDTSCKETVSV